MSSPASDRRRRRRYTVGLPVRLYVDGIPDATLAELHDVSASGCYLVSPEASFTVERDRQLAFGFVLPSREVGLVKGRVVRNILGTGFGMQIEEANAPYYELLGALAEDDPAAA